ncbi:MAG TPA: thiamine pyrophosphate-dependent enzyme [Chloroflexota bacterium]|nr:thiamine pyrophosphate-dependent enzyme [Chloroflexota bacterium]
MASPLSLPLIHTDRPTLAAPRPGQAEWGSDVVADILRLLDIEYMALIPGASYRGLHDSLVNYNGNERPAMVLCNHEEIAIAVAHGYAKLAGKPMAASVHSNVGLLNGAMGIFNAFTDRQPVLIFGGTGPMDSTRRRPWIDWIHTANGQGGAVRDYTKWEHQPSSIEAFPEAILRGWHVAVTEPAGPVYICLDAGLQEARIERPVALPDLAHYAPPTPPEPAAEALRDAARWLVAAQFPVIMLGQTAQTQQAWDELRQLAEALGAAVVTENRGMASFDSTHFLQQCGNGGRAGAESNDMIRQADVVLAINRIDVMGSLRSALGGASADPRQGRAASNRQWPRLINVSLDHLAVRSWTTDYFELPAADLPIGANAERTVSALLEEVRRLLHDDTGARGRAEQRTERHRARRAELEDAWRHARLERWDMAPISMERTAGELRTALGGAYEDTVVARVHGTWPSGVWDFTRPGCFIGGDGGAGVGSGPGMAVGIALAAKAQGRTVVSFNGDGDTLMYPTALWTAAHHRIPLLYIVVNNRSYYNDEEHQQRMAEQRSRPVENRWIGQRIDDPPVDFSTIARGLGVEAFGPVTEPDDLRDTFKSALQVVHGGDPAVVDVHISPR